MRTMGVAKGYVPFEGKEGHMSEQTSGSAPLELPEHPNLDWLRARAKERLAELRRVAPGVKLAEAQFQIATQYGFSSWRALKAHVDSLTIDGQIIESARQGDVARLRRLLDEHPDKLRLKV